MPIFCQGKEERDFISLQQLFVSQRQDQISEIVFCSFQHLINQANILPEYKDQVFFTNLEKLVNQMRALLLAQSTSQEPSTPEKQMLVNLISLINQDILELEKCNLFVKYSQGQEGIQIPEGFQEIDLDIDILSVAKAYLKERLDYCGSFPFVDFIGSVCQFIIIRFRNFLLDDCLQKEQARAEMPYILTLLILVQDDYRIKNETQRNIIYIINRITHSQVISLGCSVVSILMMQEDYTNDQADFEPEEALPEEFNLFERVSNLTIDKAVENLNIDKTEDSSDKEDQEMLSNLNQSTSASAKKLSEARKLFCSFLIDLKSLNFLPKVLQLTKEKSNLVWEDKINILRDASNEIFEWAYNQIHDKVIENDKIYQRIFSLEEYQNKYEKYVQRALLPLIEAQLVYALSNEENLYWIKKTGLEALKRMISLQGQVNYEFYIKNSKPLQDPLNIKKRRESLKNNELLQILKSLLKNSNDLELKQSKGENVQQKQLENQYITCEYLKLLSDFIANLEWKDYYNKEKGEINSLLKKLTEKEDNNEKTKAFLFDILTQINDFAFDIDSINKINIQKDKQEDQKTFQKVINISNCLLRNKKFVQNIWGFASNVSFKLHFTLYSLKKILHLEDTYCYREVYQNMRQFEPLAIDSIFFQPKILQSEGYHFFNHPDIISSVFERIELPWSWWEDQHKQRSRDYPAEALYYKKLIQLLEDLLKAYFLDKAYFITNSYSSSHSLIAKKFSNNEINQFIEQILGQIFYVQEYQSDNQTLFKELFINSNIFSKKTLQSFLENDKINLGPKEQFSFQNTKKQFIESFLDYTRTGSKVLENSLENGVFKKILQYFKDNIIIDQSTFKLKVNLLEKYIVNEKAFEQIKESELFEYMIMPNSDQNYKKTTILQSLQQSSNHLLIPQKLINLLKNSDGYFLNLVEKAIPEIFDLVIAKLKLLQKQFYDEFQNWISNKNSGVQSYSQFLMFVQEKLTESDDYYIVKFEIFKVSMMFFNDYQDDQEKLDIQPIVKRIFKKCIDSDKITNLDKFFEIYNLFSTIKPIYEDQRNNDRYKNDSGVFYYLSNIFRGIISSDEAEEKAIYIPQIKKQLENSIAQTKNKLIKIANGVQSLAVHSRFSFKNKDDGKDPVTELNHIDLIDLVSKVNKSPIFPELDLQSYPYVDQINSNNVHGHIVACISMTIQIFSDYFSFQEKQSKEIFLIQDRWDEILNDLKQLENIFKRSYIQAESLLYKSNEESKGYLTEKQRQIQSLVLKTGFKKCQDKIFDENQNLVCMQAKNLQIDLLYFEAGYENIAAIFKQIEDFLVNLKEKKPKIKQFLDQLSDIDNNNLLNISSLMDEIDRVIQQSLNNPDLIFLVNDLNYVYIKNQSYVRKRLENNNQELVNIIDSPQLEVIFQVFNKIKKIEYQSLIKYQNFDEETVTKQELDKCMSYEAYKKLNKLSQNLKEDIFSLFLIDSDRITEEMIIEQNIYNDQQEYFANYFFKVIASLFYQDGFQRDKEDLKKSLWWTSETQQMPKLTNNLIQFRGLRKVQDQLMYNIAGILDKFQYKLEEPRSVKEVKKDDDEEKLQDEQNAEETKISDQENKDRKEEKTQDENEVKIEEEQQKTEEIINVADKLEAPEDQSIQNTHSQIEENKIEEQEEDVETKNAKEEQIKQEKEEEVKNSDEEEEKIQKSQKQNEKALNRGSIISIQDFKIFLESIQKEGLVITKQWYKNSQNTPNQQKFFQLYENYFLISTRTNILQKSQSIQQVFQSNYEDTFKELEELIHRINDYQLFGGLDTNLENLFNLLQQIQQQFEILYKMINMPQLEKYFKSIKNGNLNQIQTILMVLLEVLLKGDSKQEPKDFFKIQANHLSEQNSELQVIFLNQYLELIFHCLQMYRFFEQRLFNKYQRSELKIKQTDDKLTIDQKNTLDVKYKAKLQTQFEQIKEITNFKIGDKAQDYLKAFSLGLSKFRFDKENHQELKDLTIQALDASKFICLISGQILKKIDENYQNSEQTVNLEINMQQTQASASMNISKINSQVFSQDQFQRQLKHVIVRVIFSRAQKQKQYHQLLNKSDSHNLQEIKIEKNDTEQNLRIFQYDTETILGTDDYFDNFKSKDASKVFDQISSKIIHQICDTEIPSKEADKNKEQSKIFLKESIIQQMNENKTEDNPTENQENQIQLYKQITQQLLTSSKSCLKMVDESWQQFHRVDEDMNDWNSQSMIALRSFSSISRTILDDYSEVISIIQDDFSNQDENSLLIWFKNTYVPLRLLASHPFRIPNFENKKDEKQKGGKSIDNQTEQMIKSTKIFMIADYDALLDKNLCLFLNELTGYGLLFSEKAASQRKILRESLLTSCLNTIESFVDQNLQKIDDNSLQEKNQLTASIIIIEHLINHYNQFEFNRVVLSRQCYYESLQFVINWKSKNNKTFASLMTDLFQQVQWLTLGQIDKKVTSGNLSKQELIEKLKKITSQAFASQIIDRTTKILQIFASFKTEISLNLQTIQDKEKSKLEDILSNNADKKVIIDQELIHIDSELQDQQEIKKNQNQTQNQEATIKINIPNKSETTYNINQNLLNKRLKQTNQSFNEDENENNENPNLDEIDNDEDLFNQQRQQFLNLNIAHRKQKQQENQDDSPFYLDYGIYPKKFNKYISLKIHDKRHIQNIEEEVMNYDRKKEKDSRVLLSLENIKNQQAQQENNWISQVFKILRPFSLHNMYNLGQIIENQFIQKVSKRNLRLLIIRQNEFENSQEIRLEIKDETNFDEQKEFLQKINDGQIFEQIHELNKKFIEQSSDEEDEERQKALLENCGEIYKKQLIFGFVGLGSADYNFSIESNLAQIESDDLKTERDDKNEDLSDSSSSELSIQKTKEQEDVDSELNNLPQKFIEEDQFLFEQPPKSNEALQEASQNTQKHPNDNDQDHALQPEPSQQQDRQIVQDQPNQGFIQPVSDSQIAETKEEPSKTQEAPASTAEQQEGDLKNVEEQNQDKIYKPIDLGKIISEIKDPQVRKELIQELTIDQIEMLPRKLKEEAKKFIKIQQETQSEKINQKQLKEPKLLALSKVLIDYQSEVDQAILDELSQTKFHEKILNEGSKDAQDEFEDKIIFNSLQCLIFQEFRNYSLQFLEELAFSKHKELENSSEVIQNKFVNALVFLIKLVLENNHIKLFEFFKIFAQDDKLKQLKQKDGIWTKIVQRLCLSLEFFLQKNQNLSEKLFITLLQPQKYFKSKNDQQIKFIQNLQENSDQVPPLQILQEMLTSEFDQIQNLQKQKSQARDLIKTLEAKKNKFYCIISIFNKVLKQLNTVYDDSKLNFNSSKDHLEIKQQVKFIQKREQNQAVSKFGQVSQQQIISLMNLLSLDNKNQFNDNLLQTLVNVSSFSIIDFFICQKSRNQIQIQDIMDYNSDLKLEDFVSDNFKQFQNASNLAAQQYNHNFDQIFQHLEKQGSQSLQEILDLIVGINQVVGISDSLVFEQKQCYIDLGKSQTKEDTLLKQQTLLGKPKKEEASRQLNDDEHQELLELQIKFKQESIPFMKVIKIFNSFLQKINEKKNKNQKSKCILQKKIKITDQLIHEKQSQLDKLASEISSELTNLKQEIENEQKSQSKNKQTVAFIDLIIKLENNQIQKIFKFYKNEELQDFALQVTQFLQSSSNLKDMKVVIDEQSRLLINIMFICFYPDMLLEVIESQNKKNDDYNSLKTKDAESKYVQIQKIEKLNEKSQLKTNVPLNQLELIRMSTSLQRKKQKASELLIFSTDLDNVSDRLAIFNTFCLQNKDILNEIVKEKYNDKNDSEMNMFFDLIKYMPNLLTFENKQLVLKSDIKKMKSKNSDDDFQLCIEREEIFNSSYDQIVHIAKEKLRAEIDIEFKDEPGIDVGGVRRDYFNSISKEIFNADLGLFQFASNESVYMPNPRSSIQINYTSYFKFIGRVIAKAVFEDCRLECYFVSPIYKMLAGQTLTFKDLQDVDNELYTGLNWVLLTDSDVQDLYETFCFEQQYFGTTKIIDIIENGQNIDLINENKEFYVERKAFFLMYLQFQKQIDAFLEGFYDVIPKDLVQLFTYKELELLISGMPDFNVADLKANTEYSGGYGENSQQIIWFWEFMETLDQTDKAKFLQFVTGSSKVPAQGFALLPGMEGRVSKFSIYRSHDEKSLPEGHTCYNQLDLPVYKTKEILVEKMMWAIREAQGFGFG